MQRIPTILLLFVLIVEAHYHVHIEFRTILEVGNHYIALCGVEWKNGVNNYTLYDTPKPLRIIPRTDFANETYYCETYKDNNFEVSLGYAVTFVFPYRHLDLVNHRVRFMMNYDNLGIFSLKKDFELPMEKFLRQKEPWAPIMTYDWTRFFFPTEDAELLLQRYPRRALHRFDERLKGMMINSNVFVSSPSTLDWTEVERTFNYLTYSLPPFVAANFKPFQNIPTVAGRYVETTTTIPISTTSPHSKREFENSTSLLWMAAFITFVVFVCGFLFLFFRRRYTLIEEIPKWNEDSIIPSTRILLPSNVQIGEIMGFGHFGVVRLGKFNVSKQWGHHIKTKFKKDVWMEVAIKEATNTRDTELDDFSLTSLKNEAKILMEVGHHPNLLTFIGAIASDNIKLVVQKCECNLKNYLRSNVVFQESYDITETFYIDVEGDQYINQLHLLSYSFQIANGMNFLAQADCLHRDLAARNILLTTNGVCKICDFGFAKNIDLSNYYRTQTSCDFPVRWMAPEAITVATTQSDVWSFGIVLYEIFSLGGTPYPEIPNKQLIAFIREGGRNEKPQHCPDKLYDFMEKCWQKEPTIRPSFTDAYMLLKLMLKEVSPRAYQTTLAEMKKETDKYYELEYYTAKNTHW